MSSDREDKDAGDCSHDVSGSECPVTHLMKRSQIDFEIEFFERILSRDPNYVEVLIQLSELFSRKGCHRRALLVDQRLARLRPDDPMIAYNLACSYAVLKCANEALEALRGAIRAGYADLDYMALDPDLAILRSNPEYLRIVHALESANSGSRLV